jgi:predicted glycosyltransferase
MRIIIDIGHPAHVHLFKNLAWQLQKKGHVVLFTCRDREHVVHLLKTYGFVYENFGTHYKTVKGKLWGLMKNEFQMLMTSLRFKPDMFISHGSTIAAHSSFLIKKPHIALEDTFNMEQVRLSMPFTDVVLTGDYDHVSLGKKEIRYPGYHELAYLHPNVFSPDEKVLGILGVNNDERFAIVRFVAWAATHDVGMKGMTYDNKLRLVRGLSKYIKVFISSEDELPEELKEYQIKIKPEDIHSAIAFAHMFVGESATMASESAVLGTPALYMNDISFGSINDQKKYGLLEQFSNSEKGQEEMIERALFLASNADSKRELEQQHRKLINDKIDVTAFMLWFVENYPKYVDDLKQRRVGWEQFR